MEIINQFQPLFTALSVGIGLALYVAAQYAVLRFWHGMITQRNKRERSRYNHPSNYHSRINETEENN